MRALVRYWLSEQASVEKLEFGCRERLWSTAEPVESARHVAPRLVIVLHEFAQFWQPALEMQAIRYAPLRGRVYPNILRSRAFSFPSRVALYRARSRAMR